MEFTLFGPLHLAVIGSLLIGIVLVFAFRSSKQLRYILAILLIAQIIAFNTYHISKGTYVIKDYLPLHLCTLSALIAPIALISRNKVFETLLLFWGLVPALLAIVFPDVRATENYTTFRFWEFFVSHIVIVLSSVYVAIHVRSKFQLNKFNTWKQIIFSYLSLFLYALGLAVPINALIGSNYLYLSAKSSNGMGFLPDGNAYMPSLFILTLLVFILEAFLYSILVSFKEELPEDSIQ
ncbi:MAG: TIGR02206 family membrane protein [Patescibacteria group bacterium]